MFFLIFKPKEDFILYTNQVFQTEIEAKEFASRSFKKKDIWEVVPFNSENHKKYWDKF
jgi:hypothetical protein|tara:strand:+ start:2723 stop:2896 length:174 start_codon:yes stop_codon:yes gene_type:complete